MGMSTNHLHEGAAGISLTNERMDEGMRKAQGGRYHYIRCYVSVGDVRGFSLELLPFQTSPPEIFWPAQRVDVMFMYARHI